MWMYRRHALVQKFQYFHLAELSHCSIKVRVIGDVDARLEDTSKDFHLVPRPCSGRRTISSSVTSSVFVSILRTPRPPSLGGQ